jgi:hypothetical protein
VEQTISSGAAVTAGPGAFHGKSAASWPSIIAGAFVAASATLILITLGSGIGLASISPWHTHGITATTFAVTGAIWLILTQWISAALGGYIAGRLRTRWVGTHTHEVFFRDTAHGLITWAVATVLVAAVLSSSLMSGAGASGSPGAPGSPVFAYSIDKLFRSTGSAEGTQSAGPRMETGHIIANALADGSVPDADRAYLADQVAARTGISKADAQTRVDGLIATVMQARKAAAQTSIFLALSMLIGAFIASVAAALGGRLRDEHI